MLEELPTNMEGTTTTPASSHLFNTDPGCKKLCEEQGQLFHHLVAKLLYLSKRTRQDIQTAVAFLCTRVREPDTDDYKKLTKVMQYIRNTRDMTLTIEPDDVAKWWVDSSYAVHPDMKSHTGIYMTLGKGATYTASCKQKLNTKSSTEAELVAVDDAMGQVLWTSARTLRTNHNNIPGQQEHNSISREWKILKFKENLAHQCTVLLHYRQNKKR